MSLPTATPLVSILIPSWNTRQLLAECLDSITTTCPETPHEVIVIDNGSTDGSLEMLSEHYPVVKVIKNTQNVGFARANNQGADLAQGKYLLLLNSDASLLPGALAALVQFAETHPRAAAVGPQLIYPNGSFQFSQADFPNLWREFLILSTLGRRLHGAYYPSHSPTQSNNPTPGGYIHGACMLINRQVYLQVNGLSEEYFMYAEEVDLCLTLHKKGWQVWHVPAARVIHHGGASSRDIPASREANMYQSRVHLLRKYQGRVAAWLLKAEIFLITLPKIILHALLRWASRGQKGRNVIPLRSLVQCLKEA